MATPNFKHIYGPVYSWRLGMSLGIDPLTTEQKYCSFDCTYCQLGRSKEVSLDRRSFISVSELLEEIKSLPKGTHIDYLTFSGNGEPTLASNLGELIKAVKELTHARVAVITNSTTINRKDVQADLRQADLVLFKMDAPNQQVFEAVNHPAVGLNFADIINGIKDFKKTFEGKLTLQIMFVNANKAYAHQMAELAARIHADEIQINTPLRPSGEKPLNRSEMAAITKTFTDLGLKVRSVYEEEKKQYKPFDDKSTEKRHGKFKDLDQ